MIKKNQAGQKILFFAWDVAADPQKGKTGDGGNMTVYYSLDGGSEVTPAITEIGHGAYYVSPSQAQTNGDCISLVVESATADVSIDPVFIYVDSPLVAGDFSAAALAEIAKAILGQDISYDSGTGQYTWSDGVNSFVWTNDEDSRDLV